MRKPIDMHVHEFAYDVTYLSIYPRHGIDICLSSDFVFDTVNFHLADITRNQNSRRNKSNEWKAFSQPHPT